LVHLVALARQQGNRGPETLLIESFNGKFRDEF
jgi:hypothetical protein